MMKRYNLFLFSLLILFAGACADLDELEPINSIPSSTAINNKQSVDAAMAGMYDAVQSDETFDLWLSLPQYFSDEANATGTFPTRLEFGNLNVFPANTTMAVAFTELYEIINTANNIIEAVPAITDDPALTPELVDDYVAQAKMVRAHAYMHLVAYWQEVPLITTATKSSDLGDALFVSKSSVDAIYTQIFEDLNEASKNIIAETGPLRASKQAANALLARAYLYRGDWENALAKAEEALMGVDLTTVPYLQDQIYTLGFSSADGNVLNFFYAPSDINGRYSIGPTNELIAAFEAGDLRFDQTIDNTSFTVPYGLKYPSFSAGISGTAADPIYFVRHAEMVLIAAEAAAEMDDFSTASDYFNQVRTRAGLPSITLNANNYVDAILKERFTEFAFEGGQRLIDLRRRGKAVEVLGPFGYDACDNVWPLPQREIDRNTNLVQNNCCNC